MMMKMMMMMMRYLIKSHPGLRSEGAADESFLLFLQLYSGSFGESSPQ